MKKGDGYDQLQPAYSIWLLGETLRPEVTEALHRFRLQDEQRRSLVAHGGIWLVELSKVTVATVHTEQERWLKFWLILGFEDMPLVAIACPKVTPARPGHAV